MDDIALVPVSKAHETLGIGRSKLYELAREGRLEMVHLGRRALVTKASIKAYVASLPRVVPAKQAA